VLGLLFASALNLAVVSRWIWTEALAPGWSDFLAILAVVSWFASLGYTVWWVGLCHPERHRREIDRLFREAHEAYLQGRWTDSKRRIERIWRGTKRMPMPSCSWDRSTCGRISRLWLAIRFTSV